MKSTEGAATDYALDLFKWVIVVDAFCLLKRLGKREGALLVGGFVLGSSWNLIGIVSAQGAQLDFDVFYHI